MTENEQIEEQMDNLLIEFDEMGFQPTTTVPDPEGFALNWRNRLLNALKGYRKVERGEWIFKEYSENTYTELTRIYECSICGRTIECRNEADKPFCHCGADTRGLTNESGS